MDKTYANVYYVQISRGNYTGRNSNLVFNFLTIVFTTLKLYIFGGVIGTCV